MVVKKKSVKRKTATRKENTKHKISKKKSHENKVLLGLGILIGLFLLFGFSLNTQNLTGNIITGNAQSTLTQEVKDLGTFFMNILEPLASTLLGDGGTDKTLSADLLFAKVLFFIIVLGIFYLTLNQVAFFKQSKGWMFIIVVTASIASVRWIGGKEVLQTILLPYSVVGIVVSAGLPFVIYFIVVNKGLQPQPPLVRKTAWVFFAIVFIGLWFSRLDEIYSLSWIYLATASAAILVAVMDGTLQKYFNKMRLQKAKSTMGSRTLDGFKMMLAELDKTFGATDMDPTHYKQQRKMILDKMNAVLED